MYFHLSRFEGLNISTVLAKAQTHAFTVLGMSQLFHAIGMRDVNRSVFRMNHKNNPYMIAAVVIGLALQAVVTEFSPLIRLFGTVRLSMQEWAQLLALSLTPLIVHELLVAVGGGRRRYSGTRSEQGEDSQKEKEKSAQPGEIEA